MLQESHRQQDDAPLLYSPQRGGLCVWLPNAEDSRSRDWIMLW